MGEKERHLYCEHCTNIIYPRINPAVIVGVINNDRILLTKYRDTAYNERFALIAGYAEVGETIEETVQREVMEETGIAVKHIEYYRSQPWSLSDCLLLGFFCELDGSAEITMDQNELSVAQWVSRDEIQEKPDDGSLTYEMIMKFKRSHR